MTDGVYCGRCGEGPFDGERGLRSHTSHEHPDAEPIKQCCNADIGYTPASLRPYCLDCGRILSGTDDPRVSDGGAA